MNKNPTNKRIMTLVRERDEALALLAFARNEIKALVGQCNESNEENARLRQPVEDVITTIIEENHDVLEELAKED